MRVRRVSTLTLALIGLSLLTGCQPSELDADPALTDGPATASAAPSSGAPKGRTPVGSATPSRKGPASTGSRRVVDAERAGGLPKVTGPGALTDVPVDPGDMRDGMNLVSEKYARTDQQGRQADVLVVAVDNVPEPTTTRREHLFRGMLDHLQWEEAPPEAQPVADAGALGGSVECLLASFVEDGDVVCGWADATTAGVVHFPNSTLGEAEKLIVAMRADLEQ